MASEWWPMSSVGQLVRHRAAAPGRPAPASTLPARCWRISVLGRRHRVVRRARRGPSPRRRPPWRRTGRPVRSRSQAALEADQPRQPLGAAVAGDDAQVDLGLARASAPGPTTRAWQAMESSAPPPSTGPFERRDDRLLHRGDARRARAWPRRHLSSRLLGRLQRGQLDDVGAGERAVVAGQHDALDRVVGRPARRTPASSSSIVCVVERVHRPRAGRASRRRYRRRARP